MRDYVGIEFGMQSGVPQGDRFTAQFVYARNSIRQFSGLVTNIIQTMD